MSKQQDPAGVDGKIPFGQKLFDRPFLWLGLGMVTMVVFYTLWGIVEIVGMGKAPLP